MNMEYYNISKQLIGTFGGLVILFILVMLFGCIIMDEIIVKLTIYKERKPIKIAIIIVIIYLLLIICFGVAGFSYRDMYRQQVYERCEYYIQERYGIEIIEYDQLHNREDSIYTKSTRAKIKTYSIDKKFYIVYCIDMYDNGVIVNENATIYDYDIEW